MPELVDSPKGGKMNRFKKGESGNPKGRPKTLISKLRKQGGLTKCEAEEIIRLALKADIKQLEELFKEPDMMVYARIVAGDISQSLVKKDFARLTKMLEQVYGKPKETIEHQTPKTIEIKIEGDEVE